jgi:hypothetical protein
MEQSVCLLFDPEQASLIFGLLLLELGLVHFLIVLDLLRIEIPVSIIILKVLKLLLLLHVIFFLYKCGKQLSI